MEAKVGSLDFLSWATGTLERSVGRRDLVKLDFEKNTTRGPHRGSLNGETEGREASQLLVLRDPAWVAGVGDGAAQLLPTQDSGIPLQSH